MSNSFVCGNWILCKNVRLTQPPLYRWQAWMRLNLESRKQSGATSAVQEARCGRASLTSAVRDWDPKPGRGHRPRLARLGVYSHGTVSPRGSESRGSAFEPASVWQAARRRQIVG